MPSDTSSRRRKGRDTRLLAPREVQRRRRRRCTGGSRRVCGCWRGRGRRRGRTGGGVSAVTVAAAAPAAAACQQRGQRERNADESESCDVSLSSLNQSVFLLRLCKWFVNEMLLYYYLLYYKPNRPEAQGVQRRRQRTTAPAINVSRVSGRSRRRRAVRSATISGRSFCAASAAGAACGSST